MLNKRIEIFFLACTTCLVFILMGAFLQLRAVSDLYLKYQNLKEKIENCYAH